MKVKPLSILQSPLKLQSLQMQDVKGLCQLCPANLLPDAVSLFAEIETYINCLNETSEKPTNITEAAAEIFDQRRVFPLTNRAYALAMTSPISVAKNERTFSLLKVVKNVIGSRTQDFRLNSLMLLHCERDLLDQIYLQQIALQWADQRKRRMAIN